MCATISFVVNRTLTFGMRPDEFLTEPYCVLSPNFAIRLGKIGVWHFGQFVDMLDKDQRSQWTMLCEEHRVSGGTYVGYVYRWGVMDNSVFTFIPEAIVPFDVERLIRSFDSFEQRLVNGGCVIPMSGIFSQDTKQLARESRIGYEFRLAYTIRQKFADIANNASRLAG